ncbi:MAG: hypothetical protein D6729_13770 [Deltaproteobacteria bacterium]|nr:MAG: hypothetical protein D6729_13770 [Deltaproteobacteria bacterium]
MLPSPARRALAFGPSFLAAVLASFLGAACGPTPPDYAALAEIAVDNGTCGGAWTAEEIVRIAYEQPRFEGLANPDGLPEETWQVASPLFADTEVRRVYPCADGPEGAVTALEAFGYTELSMVKNTGQVYVYEARDPYGIPGHYTLFSCDYTSDVNAQLTGADLDLGLYGLFQGTAMPDYETLATFVTRAFRTGMLQPASLDYVDRGGAVFLRISDDLTVAPFPGQDDPVRTRLDTCFTWVHPNLWGGCDTVVVGAAATLLDPEDPTRFHQLPIRGSPVYRFTGWCGRSQ